jgi:hypothetical protein
MWLDRAGRVYFTAGNDNGPSTGAPYDPGIFGHVHYHDPRSGRFGEMRDWRLHDQRAIDTAQCFGPQGVCYLADNVGHLYRFSDGDRPGAEPSWRYLGDLGQRSKRRYGVTWVLQVRGDQERAYLVTTRGHLFEFDLGAGRVVARLDLRDLEPFVKDHPFLYGFDAWDRAGRFYFVAFGPPDAATNARLVAIDPDRLFAAAARPDSPLVSTEARGLAFAPNHRQAPPMAPP